MHSWTGKSLDAALALAEHDVEGWTMEYKMRAFERDMEKLVPQEDDIEDAIPEPPTVLSGH